MNEEKARELLGAVITEFDELYREGSISWQRTGRRVSVDGIYDADELEAIAWWMRNKGV